MKGVRHNKTTLTVSPTEFVVLGQFDPVNLRQKILQFRSRTDHYFFQYDELQDYRSFEEPEIKVLIYPHL